MTLREQQLHRLLRRRRIIRRMALGIIILLLLSIALDRAGAFGWAGNDWRRFNRKIFPVERVIDGQTLVIRDGSDALPVKLIGLDAPQTHWAEQSTTYLTNRTRDRNVILRLEANRTRDADGKLLAYIYINDGDNLNLDCVRDGQCYADRRTNHTFRPQFETAEAEARNKKKPRGLWKQITEDQMPAWRQAWLNALRQERRR